MDKIFKIIEKHPTEAILLIVFVCLMFREEIKQVIKDIIRLRFPGKDQPKPKPPVKTPAAELDPFIRNDQAISKMAAYLYAVCEDIKTVYVFKSDVVFTTYRGFFEGLTEIIERERKSGRLLVISLVKIRVINDFAKEVFRDALFEAIIQNNIRLLIVFPKIEDANPSVCDLYKELSKKIKEKSPKTIQIKVDDRSNARE